MKQQLKTFQRTLRISRHELIHLLGARKPADEYSEKVKNFLAVLNEAKETVRPEGLAWWFKTPHPYLLGLRPLDLLRTPSGMARVRTLIATMRWGLVA